MDGKFQQSGLEEKSQNLRHSEDSNIKFQVFLRVDTLFDNTHPCKNKLHIQKSKLLQLIG